VFHFHENKKIAELQYSFNVVIIITINDACPQLLINNSDVNYCLKHFLNLKHFILLLVITYRKVSAWQVLTNL